MPYSRKALPFEFQQFLFLPFSLIKLSFCKVLFFIFITTELFYRSILEPFTLYSWCNNLNLPCGMHNFWWWEKEYKEIEKEEPLDYVLKITALCL